MGRKMTKVAVQGPKLRQSIRIVNRGEPAHEQQNRKQSPGECMRCLCSVPSLYLSMCRTFSGRPLSAWKCARP